MHRITVPFHLYNRKNIIWTTHQESTYSSDCSKIASFSTTMKQPCHICLLPARYGLLSPCVVRRRHVGFYWSSSPHAGHADYAYKLHVNGGVVNVINDNDRYNGYVAGDHPDGSPWFK